MAGPFFISAATLLLVALPLRAQAKLDADAEFDFWSNSRRMQAASAAILVSAQDPWTMLALGHEGMRANVWLALPFADDRPLELDPIWLKRVRDDMPAPKLTKEFVTELKASEWAYRRIYHDALVKAFQTPLEVLKKAADENPQAGWTQMMNNPPYYRGKIIAVKGKLRRLEQERAPASLRGNFEFVYDAWIQTAPDTRPIVFTFSLLPDEFKPYLNTAINEDVPVAAYGYFIMRYKYENRNKEDVTTPLVIGQTLVPGKAEARSERMSVPMHVFLILGGVFVAVFVLISLLNRWYRREDKKILDRISQLKAARGAEEGIFQDHPPEESRRVAPASERNGHAEASPNDSADKLGPP